MSDKRGHQFHTYVRIAGYQYCLKCGLIALNNHVTRKALAAKCQGDEYEQEPKRKYTAYGSRS